MYPYPRARRHSIDYYQRVLNLLLKGLAAYQRHAVIAMELNKAGILSATGSQWTDQGVTSALKKLRQNTGPIYSAMLRLCFDGVMTPAQCRPLLQTL